MKKGVDMGTLFSLLELTNKLESKYESADKNEQINLISIIFAG